MRKKEKIFNGQKVKSKKRWTALEIVLLALLIVYSLTFFVAIFWGLLTSFKEPIWDFGNGKNVVGFPNFSDWDNNLENPGNVFGNYIYVFQNLGIKFTKAYNYGFGLQSTVFITVNGNMWLYIFNTILYAGVGSLIQVFITACTAYLCAKYRYKFSTIMYMTVVFTMVIPLVGTQTAMITVLQTFNLYNNWVGNFLRVATFASMYFLVFFAFFKDLSDSYNEAAEIDGASQLRVMFSICLPLASKMMVTVFLILFVSNWNDYTTPMLFLPTKPTLSTALFKLLDQGGKIGLVPQQIASLFLLCLPIIILFVIFKKRLMGNVSMGGVKE